MNLQARISALAWGLASIAPRLAGQASVEFSWRELDEDRWQDAHFSVRLD